MALGADDNGCCLTRSWTEDSSEHVVSHSVSAVLQEGFHWANKRFNMATGKFCAGLMGCGVWGVAETEVISKVAGGTSGSTIMVSTIFLAVFSSLLWWSNRRAWRRPFLRGDAKLTAVILRAGGVSAFQAGRMWIANNHESATLLICRWSRLCHCRNHTKHPLFSRETCPKLLINFKSWWINCKYRLFKLKSDWSLCDYINQVLEGRTCIWILTLAVRISCLCTWKSSSKVLLGIQVVMCSWQWRELPLKNWKCSLSMIAYN